MFHRLDMSTHVVELRDRDLVHLATLRIARQHHESEPPAAVAPPPPAAGAAPAP
jgi:hypothetical protein